MDELTLGLWIFAFATSFCAGFVKGIVGFGLPMVILSLLGAVIPPEQALAALIIPTLLSNVWQALRGGLAEAMQAAREHWRFVVVMMVVVLLSAQLVTVMSASVMYLLLGSLVVLFTLPQLVGHTLRIVPTRKGLTEIVLGVISGLIGGITGVWSPPTVIYLNMLDTPKREHIQLQGVVYALGAIMLTLGHLKSGVLNAETIPFSISLTLPVFIGMACGFVAQDRLNQALFKRLTLVVLVLVGANLIRRGLMG